VPYRARVLKDLEVCDGLTLKEKVKFRLPLRGCCSKYLTPSKLNVFNKFSVRYYVRVKVVLRRPKTTEDRFDEDGDIEYAEN
jgi:hypothetical protein